MSARTLLIGIDEAGYGPLLGPLVVSAVAFDVPTALADGDLWRALKKSVSRTSSTWRGRVPICDSKKLFNPQIGLGPLERSVFSQQE